MSCNDIGLLEKLVQVVFRRDLEGLDRFLPETHAGLEHQHGLAGDTFDRRLGRMAFLGLLETTDLCKPLDVDFVITGRSLLAGARVFDPCHFMVWSAVYGCIYTCYCQIDEFWFLLVAV